MRKRRKEARLGSGCEADSHGPLLVWGAGDNCATAVGWARLYFYILPPRTGTRAVLKERGGLWTGPVSSLYDFKRNL